MDFITTILMLLARLCLSAAFLWAAVDKIIHWHASAEYMHSKRIPLVPLMLPLAVAMQALGGLSLFLGYHSHLGALLLILFTAPAAVKMHDFWNLSGEERLIEKTLFMKDLAILGGLLVVLALGVGHYSLTQ